jgi:N-acetylglucosamine kinase-like BadF-type ATPase
MYLGVDGGGTKTTFVVLDRLGAIRAMHQGGSAYYLETGMEPLRAMINDGVAEVLRAAGLGVHELEYAFLGLPVHGEDERTAELDELPSGTLPHDRYACGNDMVCGWAGSLSCTDGINVVCGTGSICYGEYRDRRARCGGWGELFSDEGSAYWIVREGLALFSRMGDGRAARGPLYDVIRAQMGARRDIELAAWVQAVIDRGRSHFAGLAKHVHRAAELGDPQALRIFARAGGELADMVAATRRTLAIPGAEQVPVSYSGGVFAIGALVRDPFQAALEATGGNFQLVAPRFAPVIGAALYAARSSGHPLDPTALERLAQDPRARPAAA